MKESLHTLETKFGKQEEQVMKLQNLTDSLFKGEEKELKAAVSLGYPISYSSRVDWKHVNPRIND